MHGRSAVSARMIALAVTLAPLAGCASLGGGESEAPRAIYPEGSSPNGIYSPVVKVDDMLFLSGQIGTRGPSGNISDVAGQTRQVLNNIASVLEAAGADMGDVFKCTVFLADIRDYGDMNEVYRQVWPGDPPARTTVGVAGLPAGARVEIECIAWAGDG